MPKKTLKQSKKSRRHTRRRIPRKGKKGGGVDSQSLTIPTSAFKNATPVNSDNEFHKIA